MYNEPYYNCTKNRLSEDELSDSKSAEDINKLKIKILI
jgi:hypothetical protein